MGDNIISKPFKIDNKRSLAELYSSNDIIRVLVQAIPTIGPIIDAFLAMPGTTYRDERLETFINYLYESLKRLEFRIDNVVAETEEFHDSFWAAIESSVNSRLKEKIIMNVMILSNILTVNNNENYHPEEYIKILSDLSPIESKIIAIFHKAYQVQDEVSPETEESELQRAQRIRAQELVAETLKLQDQEEIIFYLKRLERTGLVREITGAFFDYSGGRFTASRTLNNLMGYLRKHPFSKMNLHDL